MSESIMQWLERLDFELKIFMGISRSLPRLPKVGAIGNTLKRIYLRKKRRPVEADVLGYRVILDPDEYVEAEILFIPQLYDYREIAFLKKNLCKGDCFIDIGTNIGLYALAASSSVGEEGRILAVEANPATYQKLVFTVKSNDINNITAINMGVADKTGTMRLGLNTDGNTGGSSFVVPYVKGIDVKCTPLLDMLLLNEISVIHGMKLDIEGLEFRVLNKFFHDAPMSLYPEFIMMEFHPKFIEMAGGNSLEVVKSNGYREVLRHENNIILERT
ncbi:MAG: FkbM family methyltransferase [Geobacter sp.]|nr:FkbM family methyltransferase [Geobacter sp.]